MEAEATVFVVDDDADLRESLGWLLETVHGSLQTGFTRLLSL